MPRLTPVSPLCRAFAATLLLPAFAHGVLAADLAVTVENIQDDSGQVLVGVFDSAAAFPKQVRVGQRVPASQRDAKGSVSVSFTGLPAGVYAVSAVHDKDGSGKLTSNMMGMPTEPYGFTGQGSGSFGPPSFQDVSFNIPAEGASVTIAIK